MDSNRIFQIQQMTFNTFNYLAYVNYCESCWKMLNQNKQITFVYSLLGPQCIDLM